MISIEEFLSHFDGVKSNGTNSWMVKCPCHNDSKPSLGISILNGRIVFHEFSRLNPHHATTKWFGICRDAFSDILAESALRNSINPIVSIFLQKAMYGLRDTISIESCNEIFHDPLEITETTEEMNRRIAEKYADLVTD